MIYVLGMLKIKTQILHVTLLPQHLNNRLFIETCMYLYIILLFILIECYFVTYGSYGLNRCNNYYIFCKCIFIHTQILK